MPTPPLTSTERVSPLGTPPIPPGPTSSAESPTTPGGSTLSSTPPDNDLSSSLGDAEVAGKTFGGAGLDPAGVKPVGSPAGKKLDEAGSAAVPEAKGIAPLPPPPPPRRLGSLASLDKPDEIGEEQENSHGDGAVNPTLAAGAVEPPPPPPRTMSTDDGPSRPPPLLPPPQPPSLSVVDGASPRTLPSPAAPGQNSSGT